MLVVFVFLLSQESRDYYLKASWVCSFLKPVVGVSFAWCFSFYIYRVAVGFDEGNCMWIDREDPLVSMDNSWKFIWGKHNGFQTVNIKTIRVHHRCKTERIYIFLVITSVTSKNMLLTLDRERLPLIVKKLGTCDLYPQLGFPFASVAGMYPF